MGSCSSNTALGEQDSRPVNRDLLIKMLMIGDSGTGKTELMLRFSGNMSSSFISEIGIDFKIKRVNIGGTNVKLQIWDSAGSERFRTITNAYLRGTMGALLVYSVTSLASFQSVSTWLFQIGRINPHLRCALVGNECHAPESNREVTYAQGQSLADERGIPFFEASAANNINVEESFMRLASDIFDRIRTDPSGTEALASVGEASYPHRNSPPNIDIQRHPELIEGLEYQHRADRPPRLPANSAVPSNE